MNLPTIFSQIEFASPWVFLLLPLPIILRLILPRATSTNAALYIPFYDKLETSSTYNQPLHRLINLSLATVIWILLILSSAQPQYIGDTIRQPIEGRSLMMAIDLSGSMQEQDMVINKRRVSRLTAVKKVANEFILKRKGDRIGLILFGTQAYLQAPLTFDRKTVAVLLDEAQLGLAGERTSIGDAIGLAVKRLQKESEKNRVLILLTDGANSAGNIDPLKAADLAALHKVKIYTIGIGADERIVQTPFGMRRVGSSDIDEPTLKAIAQKTKGKYFRARDSKSLEKIYALLDVIEPVSKDELSFRPTSELYYYPLAIALLLSALMALFRQFSHQLFSIFSRQTVNKIRRKEKHV